MRVFLPLEPVYSEAVRWAIQLQELLAITLIPVCIFMRRSLIIFLPLNTYSSCAVTTCQYFQCNGLGFCQTYSYASGTNCSGNPSTGNPCTYYACNGGGNCTVFNTANGTSCGNCTQKPPPSYSVGYLTTTYCSLYMQRLAMLGRNLLPRGHQCWRSLHQCLNGNVQSQHRSRHMLRRLLPCESFIC